MVYAHTYRIGLSSKDCYPLLHLPLSRVQTVEECHNVFGLLAIDPILVLMVGYSAMLDTVNLQFNRYLPKSARVRLISPMMSFLRRRASRRDEQRLILRRKDSKCLASVRIVMRSVVGRACSVGCEGERGS